METSNYSLDDLNNNNKKLAEFYKNKKSVGNELKQMRVKTSLLNVDSIYREIQPKNVCDNTNTFLPKNPITTTLGISIEYILSPSSRCCQYSLLLIPLFTIN